MAVADRDAALSLRARRSPWLVAGLGIIGASLYAFANWTTFSIAIPGTEDVSIRPQYGILTFFGFAFGPLVGLITGLVGNLVGDWLTDVNLGTAWPWSVANGLVGLLTGLFGVALAGRVSGAGSRALMAGVAAVLATILGFGAIWIELVTQPELGAEYILTREYLPTVLVDSAIAAVMTPILVRFWEPLRDIVR